MQTLIDIVSSIDPQLAAVIGTALGVAVLLGLRQRYGYIPSFWRARRLALPALAELGRGDHPVDEAVADLMESEFDEIRRSQRFGGSVNGQEN